MRVSGRPESLYTIPKFHGGVDDLMVPVDNADLNYAYFHLVEVHNIQSNYHEYFEYVVNELGLSKPRDWKEAFPLYQKITDAAVNGY